MDQKSIFQKLNAFADWFIRLVLLNILIISFSLPLVTLYPAISAGYNVLHKYVRGETVSLWSDFIGSFKLDLWKKMRLGLSILLLVVVAILNVRYYAALLDTEVTMFYQIGYFISLTLLSVTIALSMVTLQVMYVAPKTKIVHTFKLSLVLAGKYYLRTVLIMVISFIPALLLFTPITSLILVFMGVTLPLILIVVVTMPGVFYLESLGVQK